MSRRLTSGRNSLNTHSEVQLCNSDQTAGTLDERLTPFELVALRGEEAKMANPSVEPIPDVHCVEHGTEFVELKQSSDDKQRAPALRQSQAKRLKAEVVLRGQEIQELNSQLRAADAARLALQTSQLVSQTEQLHEANHSLRDLTVRLLQIRDEERRRIARE